jgi:multidrug efflux pump
MALLIVYLVLAAQFESFLHPLVVMLTVPLAVARRLEKLEQETPSVGGQA